MKTCEETCTERLASELYKQRAIAKAKNAKRKGTATEPTTSKEPAKSNGDVKKRANPKSDPVETKRRKVETPTESKADEVDTSKDDVTIFLSNLEYRFVGEI